MLARMGIRVVASLVGILIGLIVSLALLGGFSATTKAIVVSTLLFWVVYLVVNFVALRILIRQPSVAMAGLLALASTIVSLVIVNIVVPGLEIRGASNYVTATVIIWIATLILLGLGATQAFAGVMRHRFAVSNWLQASFRLMQVVGHHVASVGSGHPGPALRPARWWRRSRTTRCAPAAHSTSPPASRVRSWRTSSSQPSCCRRPLPSA